MRIDFKLAHSPLGIQVRWVIVTLGWLIFGLGWLIVVRVAHFWLGWLIFD